MARMAGFTLIAYNAKMGRLQALTGRRFDLLIIGGGINGAGIAREAARRGLSVALVERLDFAAGTTSRATRLIHGGLRYLEHAELALVTESLREREALLQRAPHLVRPLPFLFPIYEHSSRSSLWIRAGMVLYDLLSLGKKAPRHRFVTDRLKDAKGAFLYYDAQVNFPERLTVETILSAEAAGAVALNHCEVLEIERRNGVVVGARVRDRIDGVEAVVEAALTINASGPWVDRMLAGVGPRSPLLSPTRGSHLVVAPYPGAPQEAVYFEARSDGRPVFIVPWNGLYLVGTTDVLDSGDPADAKPTETEIEYLLRESRLARDQILFTYAGLRPLPHSTKAMPSDVTRGHEIVDHEKRDGVPGLCSITGGKLTTYRQLARDAVGFAMKKLGRTSRPFAEEQVLPFQLWDWTKSDLEQEAAPLGKENGVSPQEVVRLFSIYGAGAMEILPMWREQPAWRRPICEHTATTVAEVIHAVSREQAQTPADVLLRRTCAALGPCRGLDALEKVAGLMQTSQDGSREEIEKTLPTWK